jgi:hypothetical protein
LHNPLERFVVDTLQTLYGKKKRRDIIDLEVESPPGYQNFSQYE